MFCGDSMRLKIGEIIILADIVLYDHIWDGCFWCIHVEGKDVYEEWVHNEWMFLVIS